MRYPPLAKPGTIVEDMTANIDLAPTLLEIAGVDWFTDFHGRTFAPLLKDPATEWRKSLLIEYFEEKVAPRCPRYFSVRTETWKYIHYPQLEGMDELYDLTADPKEQRNVIDDAATQEVLADLKERLRQLSRQTDNPFPLLDE